MQKRPDRITARTMESLLKTKDPNLYVALYALNGALREPGPVGPTQEFWWTLLIAPPDWAPRDQQACIRYRIKKLRGRQTGATELIDWQPDKCLVPGRGAVPHDDIVPRSTTPLLRRRSF